MFRRCGCDAGLTTFRVVHEGAAQLHGMSLKFGTVGCLYARKICCIPDRREDTKLHLSYGCLCKHGTRSVHTVVPALAIRRRRHMLPIGAQNNRSPNCRKSSRKTSSAICRRIAVRRCLQNIVGVTADSMTIVTACLLPSFS